MSPDPTFSLFATLPPEVWRRLEHSSDVRQFGAGAVIFHEGDAGDGLYLLDKGQVCIQAAGPDGEVRTLAEIGPGDFFGEMAILEDEPRSARAVAKEDTVVRFYRSEAVREVLESSPKLAMKLVKEFSGRMRALNRRFMEETLQAERLSLVGKFARSIVHDFKNPLGIIGMSSELGLMDDATPEMRETARGHIRKQVERLTAMISELLEFTRGEGSATALERMSFADFLGPILEDVRAEAGLKKVRIEVVEEIPREAVLLDARRLANVVFNLAHNAFDAMQPEGGTLRFSFRASGERLITDMADTGRGIPAEVLPRLFQPFATFGKSNGTGLGLSICKRIVADHRGEIAARNAPEGGAVFSFSLPLAAAESS